MSINKYVLLIFVYLFAFVILYATLSHKPISVPIIGNRSPTFQFTSDGKELLFVCGNAVPDDKFQIQRYDADGLTLSKTVYPKLSPELMPLRFDYKRKFSFSPDGSYLQVTLADEQKSYLIVLDASTGEQVFSLESKGHSTWTSIGNKLVVAEIEDAKTIQLKGFEFPGGQPCLSFSKTFPDGTLKNPADLKDFSFYGNDSRIVLDYTSVFTSMCGFGWTPQYLVIIHIDLEKKEATASKPGKDNDQGFVRLEDGTSLWMETSFTENVAFKPDFTIFTMDHHEQVLKEDRFQMGESYVTHRLLAASNSDLWIASYRIPYLQYECETDWNWRKFMNWCLIQWHGLKDSDIITDLSRIHRQTRAIEKLYTIPVHTDGTVFPQHGKWIVCHSDRLDIYPLNPHPWLKILSWPLLPVLGIAFLGRNKKEGGVER